MSTTFAVVLKNGQTGQIVARRVSSEMWFTDPMAELLPAETKVTPTDNTAQGIHTIGDIQAHIRKQQAVKKDTEPAEEWIDREKIELGKRSSAFVNLHDAWHKKHDFVEVTEWTNGEGWDIAISDNKMLSLHFTEFEAIKALIDALGVEYECNSAK
jgi:hypothetical protein